MGKALRQAIARAGGVSKLARALGVSHQAISRWDKCPVRRVLAVERASGMRREELRPDIYPPR